CFFQAEDGIRDRNVTGVQTCALPILILTAGYFTRQLVYKSPHEKGQGTALFIREFANQPQFKSEEKDWLLPAFSINRIRPLRERSEVRRVGREDRMRAEIR